MVVFVFVLCVLLELFLLCESWPAPKAEGIPSIRTSESRKTEILLIIACTPGGNILLHGLMRFTAKERKGRKGNKTFFNPLLLCDLRGQKFFNWFVNYLNVVESVLMRPDGVNGGCTDVPAAADYAGCAQKVVAIRHPI